MLWDAKLRCEHTFNAYFRFSDRNTVLKVGKMLLEIELYIKAGCDISLNEAWRGLRLAEVAPADNVVA